MDEDKPPKTERPRRSASKKAKIIPDDASLELDASTSAAPRKKRASTKSKGKGKTGKLQSIMIMPLDVLFEILSYLRPLDILHLSRTTHEFRRVLMNKTNLFVWKASRANVLEYPECFPDMNEAQMARLAFDSHCFVCLRPNCRTPDWVLRVRLCRKCSSTSIVDIHTIRDVAKETAILACVTYSGRSRTLAFIEEIESIKIRWESLKSEEKLPYIAQREEFKAVVNKHAINCAAWFELQRLDRLQELQDARNDRKTSIIKKLSELGWGPEIEQIPKNEWEDPLSQHKLVKQPTALTERIWTNIKPEMIMFMEQMKQNRLDRERQAIVISRKRPAIEAISAYKVSLLPWAEPMPEPSDYCQMAPVKAILELPSDVDIDVSSFAAVIPELPSLFAEWREDLDVKMLRLLQQESDGFEPDSPSERLSRPPSPETVNKLQLATTVFRCKTCRAGNNPITCTFDPFNPYAKFQPLFYPDALNHPCLTRELYPGRNQPDDSVDLENQRNRARTGWACSELQIDARAGEMMEAVIKFCKLDPASATVADLDELDVWLACPCCARWDTLDEAKVPIFGWRNAYKHQVEVHDSKSINWMELSEEQRSQGVADVVASSALVDKTSTTAIERWSCARCMDRTCESTPQTITDIEKHLLEQHEVTRPEVNIDYYTLGINKVFAHRGSRATFNVNDSEDLQQSKLGAMEVFARLYRKFVRAGATDMDIEEGYEDFLRQTADGYIDSDSENEDSD